MERLKSYLGFLDRIGGGTNEYGKVVKRYGTDEVIPEIHEPLDKHKNNMVNKLNDESRKK